MLVTWPRLPHRSHRGKRAARRPRSGGSQVARHHVGRTLAVQPTRRSRSVQGCSVVGLLVRRKRGQRPRVGGGATPPQGSHRRRIARTGRRDAHGQRVKALGGSAGHIAVLGRSILGRCGVDRVLAAPRAAVGDARIVVVGQSGRTAQPGRAIRCAARLGRQRRQSRQPCEPTAGRARLGWHGGGAVHEGVPLTLGRPSSAHAARPARAGCTFDRGGAPPGGREGVELGVAPGGVRLAGRRQPWDTPQELERDLGGDVVLLVVRQQRCNAPEFRPRSTAVGGTSPVPRDPPHPARSAGQPCRPHRTGRHEHVQLDRGAVHLLQREAAAVEPP
mmetsp:Transcript_13104/g.39426  ORF Transcript_13104/g.39426 Transcript_13104/m.39426 type:complete len:332 (-) Transcript_13104:357-1352(-)